MYFSNQNNAPNAERSAEPMLFSNILTSCLIYIWQKQQTQMQEVLRRLSQQQNGQSKETQQSPRRLLSSEPSEHSTLNQKHKQVVSEKDAKIKELKEEIHQLSVKVKKKEANVMSNFTFWQEALKVLFGK